MVWDAITQCIDIYEMCTGNSDLISDVLSSEPKTNNVYDFTLDGQKKKFMNLKDEIVGYWLEYLSETSKGLTYTFTSGYTDTLLKSRDAFMDEYPIFNSRGRSKEYYYNMKGNLLSGYNNVIKAGAESNIPYLSDYCKGLEGDTISDWNIIKLRGSFARGELDAIGSMVYGTIEMFIDPLETQSEIADLLAMDVRELAKIKDQALEYLDKKVKNGTAEERSEFAGSSFANIAMMLFMFKGLKKSKTPVALGEESGVEIKVAEEAELKGGSKTISVTDRIKINKWKYTPNDELYLKYKKIFDNPKYYNQKTGEIIYPGTENPVTHIKDINTNGFLNGYSEPDVIKAGKRINRFGDNGNAQYFSPDRITLEQRALPPGTETKPYIEIEVLKDIPCSSGEIAPWFDQPGRGVQYYTDVQIQALDGSMVDATLDNLVMNKYIKIVSK